MPILQDSAAKIAIALDTETYRLRTLTPEDASEKWANWFSDTHVAHMINAPRKRWDRDTIVKYIKQYDQKSGVLLGIFVRESQALIGIVTLTINHATRQALINVLIGDADFRNKGVYSDIRIPLYDYIFDKLRLKMLLASALARNHIIIDMMRKVGWKLDQTLPGHVKSNSDGTMLDLCLFSLTRAQYRAWRATQRQRGH